MFTATKILFGGPEIHKVTNIFKFQTKMFALEKNLSGSQKIESRIFENTLKLSSLDEANPIKLSPHCEKNGLKCYQGQFHKENFGVNYLKLDSTSLNLTWTT